MFLETQLAYTPTAAAVHSVIKRMDTREWNLSTETIMGGTDY